MDVSAMGARCAPKATTATTTTTTPGGVLRYFDDLPDPRTGNHVTHRLHDLITIAILAVICGADGWAQVAMWGRCKHKWLATFLDLPGGIPAHDTFGRVFARLDPVAFERCFLAWTASIVALSGGGGRLVAIDGKAIRRSFAHGWDKSGMAHLVSAFVTQGGNRLVFAQIAVDDKANEIVAIPRLLALLDLTGGAIVTIDAIGCQRAVAAQVIEQGGDYVLPVKDNQPTLLAKVKALADDLVLDHARGVAGARVRYHAEPSASASTADAHGRIESRRVWVSDQVQWLGEELLDAWAGLARGAVVVIERSRRDLGSYGAPATDGTRDLTPAATTIERHYYITSIGGLDAARLAAAIRGHWAVENNLHWQLDVTFGEDARRIRTGHAAENFSRLSRIALNLLKRDRSVKAGIKGKRLNAGWDHDYLLRLISQ
jgi:predicted transposase YbfD/YdcC